MKSFIREKEFLTIKKTEETKICYDFDQRKV